MHFQNIHIFTYQKTLLLHKLLLLLVFRMVENLPCILHEKGTNNSKTVFSDQDNM